MKRSDFLEQLRKALEHDLNAQQVQEHVNYYDEYISAEVKRGLTEQEVLEQLGDPWAIAKTILLSSKINGQGSSYDTDVKADTRHENQSGASGQQKWKLILAIVVLVLVAFAILSAALGIIAFFVRFAVPILLIVLVIRFFKKK